MYYSTFIPGLLVPVREALMAELPDAQLVHALDGLISYESKAPIESIRKLPFVTNTFQVLKSFEGDQARSIEAMIATTLRDSNLRIVFPFSSQPGATFRVVVSRASQLVALDTELLNKLENWLEHRTGLAVDRSNPDIQFWLLLRSEGLGFFSVRLTRHKAY
jgi:hypothetical protein